MGCGCASDVIEDTKPNLKLVSNSQDDKENNGQNQQQESNNINKEINEKNIKIKKNSDSKSPNNRYNNNNSNKEDNSENANNIHEKKKKKFNNFANSINSSTSTNLDLISNNIINNNNDFIKSINISKSAQINNSMQNNNINFNNNNFNATPNNLCYNNNNLVKTSSDSKSIQINNSIQTNNNISFNNNINCNNFNAINNNLTNSNNINQSGTINNGFQNNIICNNNMNYNNNMNCNNYMNYNNNMNCNNYMNYNNNMNCNNNMNFNNYMIYNNNMNYNNNINYNNNMNYNNMNCNNNIITNNISNNNFNFKKEKSNLNIIIEDVNLESEKDETILIGLNNIGATCYMNSTLQSLSNTNELTEYFLNEYKLEESNNEKKMSNEYYKLIKNLWNKDNNKKPFSPNEFKEVLSELNPLFKGIAANDSKDLVNFLLQRIHSELNVIKNEKNSNNIDFNNSNLEQINRNMVLQKFLIEYEVDYNSIISKLFYGIFETQSKCFGCQTIKYNFQVFNYIEFPLEKVNQYCFHTGKRNNFNFIQNNNVNPDIDIYECFEYYGNIDIMSGDNQMYCNFCNRNMDSYYCSVLYSLPKILIINLNRGRGAAYQCNVNFTEHLDLFNYISNKSGKYLYELYAIICHIGPSSSSGHFVAYCKNRMDKMWYLYNDGLVSKCKSYYEYKGKMPYILFYRAK